MTDVIYENSHQEIPVTYLDTDNSVIPAGSVGYAKYAILDSGGNCILTKETGNGISVVGDQFLITIDQADITQSGANFSHQFSVGDTSTELEPPIFNNQLAIGSVTRCP